MLVANSSATSAEFFDAFERAIVFAEDATLGEQQLIAAFEAGVKNETEIQREQLERLVETFPGDERARMALGAFHFGLQEYSEAIAQCERAIEIAPDYSPPLNQLGYALRFTERYADAERVFPHGTSN